MARKPKAESEALHRKIIERLLAGDSGRSIAQALHTTRFTVRQVKKSLARADPPVAHDPDPLWIKPVNHELKANAYTIDQRVRLDSRDWTVKWIYDDGFLRLLSVFGQQPRDRVDPADVTPL